MSKPDLLRRREALAALGVLGLAAALPKLRGLHATDPAQAACVLMPEQTEGPYWVANHLTRRDITENRPGMPLALTLAVQDASSCHAIKAADVEIWHCDARGSYSGVRASRGTHYLRGHQTSNASGVVRFDTIYPGWYRGRTPHIHVKVHVGGVVHTGQLFFPDAVTRAVYRTKHYASRGRADTTNAADMIYANGGGRTTLRPRRRGRGYRAGLTLGVRRS